MRPRWGEMDTATGSLELRMEKVILRKASQQDDQFFRAVYTVTRTDEMTLLSWPPGQKTAFLQMLFTAQKTHYAAHFPSAHYFVIECTGLPIGRLIVEE